MKKSEKKNKEDFENWLPKGSSADYISHLNSIAGLPHGISLFQKKLKADEIGVIKKEIENTNKNKAQKQKYNSALNALIGFYYESSFHKINSKNDPLIETWKRFMKSNDELREHKLSVSIPGDFAEILSCNYLKKAIKNNKSNKGFDAFIIRGNKIETYQIKSVSKNDKLEQLSYFNSDDFDYLIVILFNKDGSIHEVYQHSKTTLKNVKKIQKKDSTSYTYRIDENFKEKAKSLKANFIKKFPSLKSSNKNEKNYCRHCLRPI